MKFIFSSIFLMIVFCKPVQARPGPPPVTDWTVNVGVASFYSPVFIGAKDYKQILVPDLQVKYRNRFFASMPSGIGYNIITRKHRENGWQVGPVAKLKFGRNEDGSSAFTISGGTDALQGMGDIDTAYEFGGFADYRYEFMKMRLSARRGFGGHNGMVSDFGFRYVDNLGPLRFSIGPKLQIATSDYMQTYFGISEFQSLQTDMDIYRPDTGIVLYGLRGFAIMPITNSVAATLFSGFDILGAGVRNSPLVQLYGRKNQFSFGMGLSYRFGFNNGNSNEQPNMLCGSVCPVY